MNQKDIQGIIKKLKYAQKKQSQDQKKLGPAHVDRNRHATLDPETAGLHDLASVASSRPFIRHPMSPSSNIATPGYHGALRNYASNMPAGNVLITPTRAQSKQVFKPVDGHQQSLEQSSKMNALSSNCPSVDPGSVDYTQRSIRDQLDVHMQALADVNRSQQHQMHRHNV